MRWQICIHFILRMTNAHCVYWQWFEEFSVSLPNKEFPIQFKVWVSWPLCDDWNCVFLMMIFICIIIIIVLTLTIALTFRIIAHWHRINCWVDLNSTSDHLHRIKCTTCGFRSLWVFIFTHQYIVLLIIHNTNIRDNNRNQHVFMWCFSSVNQCCLQSPNNTSTWSCLTCDSS